MEKIDLNVPATFSLVPENEKLKDCFILKVPNPILSEILSFLSIKEVILFSRLCKQLWKLSHQDFFWESSCRNLGFLNFESGTKESFRNQIISFYQNQYQVNHCIQWSSWKKFLEIPKNYESNMQQTPQQYPVLKIRILGAASIGRKTFCHRFLTGKFFPEISNDEYEFPKLCFVELNNKLIKLDFHLVVPFRGYFFVTSPSFYRGVSTIILCYDITNPKSFIEMIEWAKDTKRYVSSRCRFIVVGLKSDLSMHRKVELKRVKDYCLSIQSDYFEISSKTGSNVDTVFAYVVHQYLERKKKAQSLKDSGEVSQLSSSSELPVSVTIEQIEIETKKKCCSII